MAQMKTSHTLDRKGQWPVFGMWEGKFLSSVVCLTP